MWWPWSWWSPNLAPEPGAGAELPTDHDNSPDGDNHSPLLQTQSRPVLNHDEAWFNKIQFSNIKYLDSQLLANMFTYLQLFPILRLNLRSSHKMRVKESVEAMKWLASWLLTAIVMRPIHTSYSIYCFAITAHLALGLSSKYEISRFSLLWRWRSTALLNNPSTFLLLDPLIDDGYCRHIG